LCHALELFAFGCEIYVGFTAEFDEVRGGGSDSGGVSEFFLRICSFLYEDDL
jgi:hypothetical protein